jgi:CubicO group peptidase (beta-lactamase class C family)
MGKMLFFIAAASLSVLTGCREPSFSDKSRASSDNREIYWSPTKLEAAAKYAKEIGSAAVLVLCEGETVFIYGDVARKYMCHSIRKPFLGALYGIYVARGMIDIEATLAELHINDISPSLMEDEKQATVRDLLMSRSGVYHQAAGEIQPMIDARPKRGSHAPGTFFYYNNWDFNTLGTIFERTTGKKIFDAFNDEIAEPIGMEDFDPADCTYVYERSKSAHPAYFFRMSARDMVRFGLLYQNDGRWGRKQIVPAKWIRESTAVYPVQNPGGDPYGYLWRIIPEEAGWGYGYYHTGFGVHLLAVLPDQKLVLVHRVDMDSWFDISWSEIRTLMEMIVDARRFPAEREIVGRTHNNDLERTSGNLFHREE